MVSGDLGGQKAFAQIATRRPFRDTGGMWSACAFSKRTDTLSTCCLPILREAPDTLAFLSGPENPEGPNLEKFQDRPPGLKFSSEIETNDIFKRD